MRFRIKKAKSGFTVTVEDAEGKVVATKHAADMKAAVKARDEMFVKENGDG